MKLTKLTLIASLAFGSLSAFAQTDSHSVAVTIQEVAIVGITSSATDGDTSLDLSPDQITEAGKGLDVSSISDNSLWLNYSSIIASDGVTRSIGVKLDNELNDGYSLKLTVGDDAGNGAGTMGTAAAQVTLSTSESDIVTGIGSSYTGAGANNGRQLTYTLEIDEAAYGDIYATTETVNITYTITE